MCIFRAESALKSGNEKPTKLQGILGESSPMLEQVNDLTFLSLDVLSKGSKADRS